MTRQGGGEMPFLEHLEELRTRLLKVVAAVIAGFAAGLVLVERFQLVSLLKRPIEPYLPDGKLVVLSPTDPVMIVLKLGLVTGLVLASPYVIYQVWAFVAPALYDRERRVIVPSLLVGMLLFLAGGAFGYLVVVPQALRVLFSFQSEALATMITYDAYFGFVLQIVLALGLSCELPLLIIILALLGVATPARLNHFRRYAIVGAFVAGAFLSPGADVLSMILMTLPLLVLYEVGFVGSVIITRRRQRAEAIAAALVVLALALQPASAGAQEPGRPPSGRPAALGDTLKRDTPADSARRARADSLRLRGQPIDTAEAATLGLPTKPSLEFAPDDSTMKAMRERPGYVPIRFRADAATLDAEVERLQLRGRALTQREQVQLEADTILYFQPDCVLDAHGEPKLFDEGKVLLGTGILYDTCRRRGVVREALTSVKDRNVEWFVRGNVAQDSVTTRLYAGDGGLTSCKLPVSHYRFAAREIKWVSGTSLTARSVVLYLRDVPVLWLPFLHQDLRPGRRSGLLVPKFGLADLVRFDEGYQRQITNIGYYFVLNDQMDLTVQLDWFSGRNVRYGGRLAYQSTARRLGGSLGIDQTRQTGAQPGTSTNIAWSHNQQFNNTTSVRGSLNYQSDSRVNIGNTLNPDEVTRQISSSVNLDKRFRWGTVNLGGSRRQTVQTGAGSGTLPQLSITPMPIALSRSVSWNPTLNLSRSSDFGPVVRQVVGPGGTLDTISVDRSNRTWTVNMQTPLRFGGFQWQNSLGYVDRLNRNQRTVTFTDPGTGDTTTVTQVLASEYGSEVNWETGINLPVLFSRTWRITPSLGVTNVTSGPFAVRNQFTQGDWVTQGKRFAFSLSSVPSLFAFLPGIVPGYARLRHTLSPVFSFQYAPSAQVSAEYARAIAGPGQPIPAESPRQLLASVSLNTNLEGKTRPQAGDSLGTTARKVNLLALNFSQFSYDFERAKQPGNTGWVTQSMNISARSDLLPTFSANLGFDLWEGVAGIDTSRFKPYLQTVSAQLQLSGSTFRALGRLLGVGGEDDRRPGERSGAPIQRAPSAYNGGNPFFGGGPRFSTQRPGFNLGLNYSLARTRTTAVSAPTGTSRQTLAFTSSFSPTPYWGVSWQGIYNLSDTRFEQQSVSLERNLHEWRASFSFDRTANGNAGFRVSVYLIDLPDIKPLSYNESTFER